MDRALLARVERQAWFHRFPRGLPAALLLVGLAVTVAVVIFLERADREAAALALDNEGVEIAARIAAMGSENVAYLNAAASMFSLSDDVSQADLAQYVADISSNHRERGIVGVGWARWIKRPAAPDMAVITYLAPRTPQNVAAIGYDMYSEPVRRAAMDRARATRKPATTGRVVLVQDQGHGTPAGALVYVPVFARGGAAAAQGQARLKGFVYTPIRIRELLRVAVEGASQKIAFAALHDGPPGKATMLASFGSPPRRDDAATQTLEFAGRPWTLVVMSGKAPGLTLVSQFVLGLGGLISLLLTILAWFITHRAADDRKVLQWLTRQTAIRTSLTRELHHRVKNTLANVLSIVSLTRQRSTDVDEFADGLVGRIRALSATHDLLSLREWKDAPVADVIASELAPYLDPDDQHAEFSGPDVLLAPNEALSLGLAIHELATNAAKYGALSVPEGRVSVNWSRPAEDRCEVIWQETNGPLVVPPAKRGFGLELIERIVSKELQAPIALSFEPGGVRCVMPVPVRTLGEFSLDRDSD